MSSSPTWLVVAALAVWRLTHLLVFEDGPLRVFARVRAAFARVSLGAVFDCPYCMSLWVAIPFAIWLGGRWGERALLWLGLSGAACVLERLGPTATPPSTLPPPDDEGPPL